MDFGSERLSGLCIALVLTGSALAQQGTTFAYTGEDALADQLNLHRVNYGGFTNNFAVQDQEIVWPWLPTLFYEHGHLLMPQNKQANLCFTISPEVFLTMFFMGRVTATADVVLLNEAGNKPTKGVGLRVGAGYSALGSTFGFSETTPILRAGLLISNIRFTYAYSLSHTTIIDHQFGVGIKFDW
jgi:hypothetical protein